MLRRLASAAAVVVTAVAVVGITAAPASAHSPRPSYYLALGDSLAYGYQPTHVTGQGYVDDLYAKLHARDPRLALRNLGCPGETSGSMLTGGVCPYPGADDQLDAALSFLREHHGQVRLITLDIGANDVDHCLSTGAIDQTCIADGLEAISGNLAQIMRELRAAAPFARIVGMNYYDPFLASYLSGPTGPALAQQSLVLADQLNTMLETLYQQAGARVADVAAAFSTDDFTTMVSLQPGVTVPLNVARVCQWTWMCTVPPGPDIHANQAGYAVMADAFDAQMTPPLA
jgi:lysophospholipase L1-like esterase